MLEKYYRINNVIGVDISLMPADAVAINACGVAVEGSNLNFWKKITGIASLEELAKHFPAKAAIALNLSGRGILQKQVERVDEINQDNFGLILPNASAADFYIQNFISGNQSFVSVIRKAEAYRWIHQLTSLGFNPLMLSLGPFAVSNIIAQVNVYGEEVIFNGHTIQRNESLEWTHVSYNTASRSQFPLKVESEPVDEKLLIAYASAFQLVLAGKIQPVQADVEVLQSAFDKLVEEKKFKTHGFVLLSVFFAMLLINFIWFSVLNSSNAKLTEQVSRSAQSTDDVQKITQTVQQKEALLKALGWEAGVNKSALIDQVASLLPPDISWKEANIDPIDIVTSRLQKSIAFYNRRIRIVGNSEKIIPVNEWIARIKTAAWVKNVQLDSYTFNSELNTGQFIILIDY